MEVWRIISYQNLTIEGRQVIIYLPLSYKESPDRTYPVVYVQDGGKLAVSCLNEIDHLVRQQKLQELIIVGIEPHDRNHEYTPWHAGPIDIASPVTGGQGRAYIDELADKIKPYIDDNYRTQPDAVHTAIIGGSFGGLISLFAGYWRPDTFGRLGLLSASFWYEGVLDYVREQPTLNPTIKLYMSVGTCEGIYKTNVQQLMVSNTREAYAAWVNKDGGSDRIRFVQTEGGTHDHHYMAARFPEALCWLFPLEPSVEKTAMAEDTELPYTIPDTRQWSMYATRSGLEYRISVYVPAVPPPKLGYSILYALDGNASFGSLTEAMRLQSRPPHGFAPGIVVGICYPSDEVLVTKRRFLDFTTKAIPSTLPQRPDRSPWPETGGADNFLSFIEDDLKPVLESRYPIDRKQQTLFGHSLGGWFTLHVMAERSEAFTAYVAGSPSVWWNGGEVVQRLLHVLESRPDLDLALYIGIGSNEKPSMLAGAEKLYAALLPFESRGLQLNYRVYQDEGHVSIIHPLISGMLRYLAKKESRLDRIRS